MCIRDRFRWIKAPPLVFQSKKTEDYHEDMNAEVFEKWFFDTLLPAIPPGSTIFMDNAPYHSRVKDKAPTSSSTRLIWKTGYKHERYPLSLIHIFQLCSFCALIKNFGINAFFLVFDSEMFYSWILLSITCPSIKI